MDSPSSPWIRKPPWVTSHGGLKRHLSLFDLVCVGVGATVGSGIFVLCGLIAHDYAGPATVISWAIAGVAACFSGLCYAELAGKYPTAGSSYAYSYVSMGELPAVIAGACLTLEYIFSASAVARSWGDKIVEYIRVNSLTWENQELWNSVLKVLDPGLGFNPMAFLVSAASVTLLLKGVKESKKVTNIFTVIKMCLVLFMAFGSLYLLNPSNLSPLVPPQFGASGIFRGATSSFFGYIGFDEICCMSGEAKNPSKNLPRAVIASLLIVTSLYMFAAVALTGMVPYEDISSTSAFPDGFRYRGWEVAAEISAWGELFTLPLVVLVTIMAQPRLQYAMSIDGLLPPIFAQIDETGNLWFGTLISGILMVLIATFVPFVYLDDLISAGILVAFSMTDTSVVLLRHDNPDDNPNLLEKLLGLFHTVSFVTSLALGHCIGSTVGSILTLSSCIFLLVLTRMISKCPLKSSKCGVNSSDSDFFEAPLVPYLPLLGTFINWYLIAQLEWLGLTLLVAYVGISVVFYFSYGLKHSVGNTTGWDHIREYDVIPGENVREDQPMKSKISLSQINSHDSEERGDVRARAGSF
eukprot:CAMPEP_0113596604 /NCGR_PEP_ID=MMETSP0015_2-20120614/40445_1 /TAXON_ID=2838 /ORGANISM="Odontella" /LENGTH=580 /DNA_ID=CAMNT_0000504171 /DNA_START=298 /DNA_END=2040 /DNA_ORIENTATION=+ /assembly_acc=CAM_ASM_000160